MHDLAGIERVAGIEALFHFLEGMNDPLAEHLRVKFRAHDSVAVFAGMRAFIFAHHREGLFGDGAHGLDVVLELEIQHRADVQTAFGGVGIHGAARAVLLENPVEPVGIVGELRQRHCTVLDEGNRLSFLLHRHHDVEAGGAEVSDRRLHCGLDHIDHAAPFALWLIPAETEIAHQVGELLELCEVGGLIGLRKFDDQQRFRLTLHHGFDSRPEHRDVAAKRDHGAVDQLHRDGLQLHQMLRGVHCFIEAAEVADAENFRTDQRPQLQLDAGGKGERPFGADQQMRHVVDGLRCQRIEVVAADPALHMREARRNLTGLTLTERQHVAKQVAARHLGVLPSHVARYFAEMQQGAVGQRGVHRNGIVAHGAVTQRAAAAGIVAGHAADGGARGGGDVDRKPQAVFLQLPVEIVEHNAGLDHAGALLDIERDDSVQILRDIDHDAAVDSLAALRGAAAARRHDASVIARNRHGAQRVVHGAGNDHAERLDLVERRVGGVAAAIQRMEQDIAADFAPEACGEGAVLRDGVSGCGLLLSHLVLGTLGGPKSRHCERSELALSSPLPEGERSTRSAG